MPTRVLVRMLERNGETRAKSVGDVLKLGDLPVIEIPGKPGAGDVAIIFSGDGGWRDLDRTLGEILSNAGVKPGHRLPALLLERKVAGYCRGDISTT